MLELKEMNAKLIIGKFHVVGDGSLHCHTSMNLLIRILNTWLSTVWVQHSYTVTHHLVSFNNA